MHMSTRLGARILLALALLIGAGVVALPPAHGDDQPPDSLEHAVAVVNRARLASLAVFAPTAQAPAPPTIDSHEHEGAWAWPIGPDHDVVRFFEAPVHAYGPGHRGIDIVGSTLVVHAVESGTVTFAGTVAGKPVVAILHDSGLTSTYEPVLASVAKGDAVSRGQVLSLIHI